MNHLDMKRILKKNALIFTFASLGLIFVSCVPDDMDEGGETVLPDSAVGISHSTKSESMQHQLALAMNPVGYWPLDGTSDLVGVDLTNNQNHATINHVPWSQDEHALHFTGAYQWLEIPAHPAYQSPSFSVGGWVFLRSDVMGSGWPNRQGFLLMGNKHWLNKKGVQLAIRKENVIDVVSDGVEDVVGSRKWVDKRNEVLIRRSEGQPALEVGSWHHIFYTYESAASVTDDPVSENLALTGRVTASSDGGHSSRVPSNANDGDVNSNWVCWYSDSALKEKAWIQLDFPDEISLNRIRLVNNRHHTDPWLGAQLLFSDGSTIDLKNFSEEWDGMFATKKVNWVRLETENNRSLRPGISEFEVYHEDFQVFAEEGVITSWKKGQEVKGTGRLYVDGKMVHEGNNITYTPVDVNLQIGNDAYWWHQMLYKSGSLDGSVRHMLWFDRSLEGAEVDHLTQISQSLPKISVPDEISVVMDGKEVTLEMMESLDGQSLSNALRALTQKEQAILIRNKDKIIPVARHAIHTTNASYNAVKLLNKIGETSLYKESIPHLISIFRNEQYSQLERADAVMALSSIGEEARRALPAIMDLLESMEPAVPKVEQSLRNSLILACVEIEPNNEEVISLLNSHYAKPILDLINRGESSLLDAKHQQEIEFLIESKRYWEAIQLYASLPLDQREDYVTYKKDRDYTGTAFYKGYTYKVGTGVAWEGVEKVSSNDYNAIVGRISAEYPSVSEWRNTEFPHLYRVPITRISPDGQKQKIYLEGENFVLDGHDAKCRAWSIFVDASGYIHLLGGQHNSPNPDYYVPGSWEKMGISREKGTESYPMQMYWVSSRPEDISSFEFVGQRNSSRAIPADYLNYMVLAQDKNRNIYLYGRSEAYGIQCWGLFRYDANKQNWESIGGDPVEMLNDVDQAQPEWRNYLHDHLRSKIPGASTGIKKIAWAWHPPFYNFCRDEWGLKIDKTGRLHIQMAISGLDGQGYVRPSRVYAWSDDQGDAFHTFAGKPLALPLTVNPAPNHNAEIHVDNCMMVHDGEQYLARDYFDLWVKLIQRSGFKVRE